MDEFRDFENFDLLNDTFSLKTVRLQNIYNYGPAVIGI